MDKVAVTSSTKNNGRNPWALANGMASLGTLLIVAFLPHYEQSTGVTGCYAVSGYHYSDKCLYNRLIICRQ